MKSDTIRRAIGEIDDDLIESAEKSPETRPASAWKKWAAAAAVFAVLIGTAFIMYNLSDAGRLPVQPSEESIPKTESSGEGSERNQDSEPASSQGQAGFDKVIWAVSDPSAYDEGLTEWEGKRYVTCVLKDVLENSQEDDIIAVRIRPYIDPEYVFEGRTLESYYLDMSEESNLPEKLRQLLKVGDELKYGDRLWQEGNEDGVKWYKTYYEETVAWYGRELLDRYIEDGEFYAEKVQADLEKALVQDTAERAYRRAENAFLEELCRSIHGTLPSELRENEYGPYSIIAFFTKKEFASFTREDDPYFQEWSFHLAVNPDDPYYAQYGMDENE